MIPVHLVGGPCDGLTVYIPSAPQFVVIPMFPMSPHRPPTPIDLPPGATPRNVAYEQDTWVVVSGQCCLRFRHTDAEIEGLPSFGGGCT